MNNSKYLDFVLTREVDKLNKQKDILLINFDEVKTNYERIKYELDCCEKAIEILKKNINAPVSFKEGEVVSWESIGIKPQNIEQTI